MQGKFSELKAKSGNSPHRYWVAVAALLGATAMVQPAQAQLLGGGNGGGLGGALGGVTDTVGDVVGGVTDTVDSVVGGLTGGGGGGGNGGGSTGGLTDTVGDVVGGLTGGGGGGGGGNGGGLTDTVGGVVGGLTGGGGGDLGGVSGTVDGVVDTVGDVTGGLTGNRVRLRGTGVETGNTVGVDLDLFSIDGQVYALGNDGLVDVSVALDDNGVLDANVLGEDSLASLGLLGSEVVTVGGNGGGTGGGDGSDGSDGSGGSDGSDGQDGRDGRPGTVSTSHDSNASSSFPDIAVLQNLPRSAAQSRCRSAGNTDALNGVSVFDRDNNMLGTVVGGYTSGTDLTRVRIAVSPQTVSGGGCVEYSTTGGSANSQGIVINTTRSALATSLMR